MTKLFVLSLFYLFTFSSISTAHVPGGGEMDDGLAFCSNGGDIKWHKSVSIYQDYWGTYYGQSSLQLSDGTYEWLCFDEDDEIRITKNLYRFEKFNVCGYMNHTTRFKAIEVIKYGRLSFSQIRFIPKDNTQPIIYLKCSPL